MRLSLKRFSSNDKRTLGFLSDGANHFYTLELPWRDNARRISCIPAGTYKVVPTVSPSKGMCFKLLDVPGRTEILIHRGNTTVDSQGCILIGNTAQADSVGSSSDALSKALSLYTKGFELEILEV